MDTQFASRTAESIGECLAGPRFSLLRRLISLILLLAALRRRRPPLVLTETSLAIALSGPDASSDLLVKVKSVGALVRTAHSVQARVELVALRRVRTVVDSILAGAISVAGLGLLQFRLAAALVLGVLHVVARVLLVHLVRVEHESVGTQSSLQLAAAALEVPVALLRMREETVGLRAHKVDLGRRQRHSRRQQQSPSYHFFSCCCCCFMSL